MCLCEPDTGSVWGYVVVDNLIMGPSLGGVRMAPDITVQEVYGLASAMTFKNASASPESSCPPVRGHVRRAAVGLLVSRG